MPRMKSVRRSAGAFRAELATLRVFVTTADFSRSPETYKSWVYEYAVIRLYREFEKLMLDALVGAMNNDTSLLEETLGFRFPKHLTDEVCEFLVTRGGYFDFKGRDGLIDTLKKFVPGDHYLIETVTRAEYRRSLELLSTLRNYSAHDSEQAKRRARDATGMLKIGSAGSWLKTAGRFDQLLDSLGELAGELEQRAPY